MNPTDVIWIAFAMSLGPSTKKVCLNDISLQVSKVGFLNCQNAKSIFWPDKLHKFCWTLSSFLLCGVMLLVVWATPLLWRCADQRRWVLYARALLRDFCVGSMSGWLLASDLSVYGILKAATSLRRCLKDSAKPVVSGAHAEVGAACWTARLHSWQRLQGYSPAADVLFRVFSNPVSSHTAQFLWVECVDGSSSNFEPTPSS